MTGQPDRISAAGLQDVKTARPDLAARPEKQRLRAASAVLGRFWTAVKRWNSARIQRKLCRRHLRTLDRLGRCDGHRVAPVVTDALRNTDGDW